jgi:glycosyltransferase involved in cell wall biosynthesis
MNKPLLSICIATYNRADYIGETLNSIIPQLDDEVEIVVVDGASTDKTQEVVEEFVRREPRIHYVRLPAKGGVDQDYNKAVELARGEFCWLFTDDDLLKPGAIAAIKTAIAKGYDLVVVNAEVRDNRLTTILDDQRMIMRENKEYAPRDVDDFFVNSIDYLSFIGAVVIRRSVWLGRDREQYLGTEFIHIGVIFQKALEASILVIADPYIIIRWGNAQWTPRGFDIWMFKWPKLIWSFEDISSEAKQRVVKREPWRNLKNLIIYRRTGSYNIYSYQKYFSKVKTGNIWRFFAFAIAIFPTEIITPFYYCVHKVRFYMKKYSSAARRSRAGVIG